MSTEVLVLFF